MKYDPVLTGFNELESLTLKDKFNKDYRDLPVGAARKRKMEHLRRLKKGGVHKEQLMQHGRRMNMYGSDIAVVLHED